MTVSWPQLIRRAGPVLLVVALGVALLSHLVTVSLQTKSRETALALAGQDLLSLTEALADTPASMREEDMLALVNLRGLRAATGDDCAVDQSHRPVVLMTTGDGRRGGTPGWTPPVHAGGDIFDETLPAQAACSHGNARAVGLVQAVGDGRLFVGRVYRQDPGPALLIWGVGFGVLLLMAGALVLVHVLAARSAARDVARLAAHLEQAAEDRFRSRIPQDAFTGDIGQLAGHANTLLDRAQGLLDELSHLQGYIAHDIGNPLLAARKVVEQRAVLTEADRDALRLHLDRAERRRRAVLNIIGARISGDEEFQSIRPGERVRRLVEDMFAWLAEDKRLSFSVEADDSAVDAPPDVLDRMLENVLLNAVEHAEAGSVIRINVQRDGDRCRIDIANSGASPSQDDLPRLFEPGVRRGAVGGGHGLGLAFVRTAATRLGGTVEGRITPDGFGVRFDLPSAKGA